MRSLRDRVRYVILFELLGLLIVVPAGVLLARTTPTAMTGVAVVSATIATLWNLLYNYLFDLAALKLYGSSKKTHPMRLVHTTLFEVGLISVCWPINRAILSVGWLEAFAVTTSLALFYIVFNYFFTWAYDWVFPAPGPSRQVKVTEAQR